MTEGHSSSESAIARMLSHRYGDGCVYVPREAYSGLFREAVRSGFLSEDGYVTRKGRILLTRYAF